MSLLLTVLLATAKRRAARERDSLLSEMKSTISFIVSQTSRTTDALSETSEKQLDLLEKSFAQLRATNAWEYQSIMSMAGTPAYDEPYDPSPEADAKRIADRQNAKDDLDEALSAEEESVLADIFPGAV